MESIEDIQKHFEDVLVHKDLRRTFYVLRQNIDQQSFKYDDLNLLHARYSAASHDQHVKGILSFEDAAIQFNRIQAALFELIKDLQPEDLLIKVKPTPTEGFNAVALPTPTTKGKILYRVPDTMEIQKDHKCIVRIAFTEEELEYLTKRDDSTKVEPVKISDVMMVQFLDECNGESFAIRSLSSEEQFIDRGDYTEWIFYVKPLLAGVYDLLLKVSVIEKRMDREVRKDIVLEKKIEVVTAPLYDDVDVGEQKNTVVANAAAGALFVPNGFEVMEQPFILEVPCLPPLDPGPVDVVATTVPPPYSENSWLLQLANYATIGIISLIVVYIIGQPIANNDDLGIQDFFPSWSNVEEVPNGETEKVKKPLVNYIPIDTVKEPAYPFPNITEVDSLISRPVDPLVTVVDPPKINKPNEVPNEYDGFLKIKTTLHKKTKKLSVNVEGDKPPFKVFINAKKEATLNRKGDFHKPYEEGPFVNGQKLAIEVEDNKGNKSSESVTIDLSCALEEVAKPMKVIDCFDFEQFGDNCSILYLFQKGTAADERMKNNTFTDCGVVDKIKEGRFKFYEMEMKTISSNCDNDALEQLDKEVTTFVYQGQNATPIQLDGFVDPNELGESLVCFFSRGKGGTRKIPVEFETNITYQYSGGSSKGLSIKKAKKEHRVRIATFSNEANYKLFIKAIEDLGYPIYIRLEDKYYRVYLGGFDSKVKAEALLKELQKNEKLKTILEKARIKKILVNEV